MVAPLRSPMARKLSWKPLKRVLIEKPKRGIASYSHLPPTAPTFPAFPFAIALRRA